MYVIVLVLLPIRRAALKFDKQKCWQPPCMPLEYHFPTTCRENKYNFMHVKQPYTRLKRTESVKAAFLFDSASASEAHTSRRYSLRQQQKGWEEAIQQMCRFQNLHMISTWMGVEKTNSVPFLVQCTLLGKFYPGNFQQRLPQSSQHSLGW